VCVCVRVCGKFCSTVHLLCDIVYVFSERSVEMLFYTIFSVRCSVVEPSCKRWTIFIGQTQNDARVALVSAGFGLSVTPFTSVNFQHSNNCPLMSIVHRSIEQLTQPFTLRGTVKWLSASGLSNNNKWRWWMWTVAAMYRRTHSPSQLTWSEGWRR